MPIWAPIGTNFVKCQSFPCLRGPIRSLPQSLPCPGEFCRLDRVGAHLGAAPMQFCNKHTDASRHYRTYGSGNRSHRLRWSSGCASSTAVSASVVAGTFGGGDAGAANKQSWTSTRWRCGLDGAPEVEICGVVNGAVCAAVATAIASAVAACPPTHSNSLGRGSASGGGVCASGGLAGRSQV